MFKLIVKLALPASLVFALGVAPANASGTPTPTDWPATVFPQETDLYSNSQSVTNTEDLTYVLDNSGDGGSPITRLEIFFSEFDTGLVATSNEISFTGNSIVISSSPDVSSSVAVKVAFLNGSSGNAYRIGQQSINLTMEAFTGTIEVTILAGTLTSVGNEFAHSLFFTGYNSGPAFLFRQDWFDQPSGGSQGPGSQGFGQRSAPPAKYAGPEFSALSSKLVTVGSSSVLEGKRLNEVSSITIGGKSATFTATATELKLDVPTDLAPGIYDLVIQSAAGKLTHMNAVRVQAPRRSLSITTVAEGRVTQNQFAEHALIASMQPRDLNRVRCIVNGPNLAAARAQAEQLCAAVRSANRHIETGIVEPRSTVRDNKVYARVTYGWN